MGGFRAQGFLVDPPWWTRDGVLIRGVGRSPPPWLRVTAEDSCSRCTLEQMKMLSYTLLAPERFFLGVHTNSSLGFHSLHNFYKFLHSGRRKGN